MKTMSKNQPPALSEEQEYDLLLLNEWPVHEWRTDYHEAPVLMKELMTKAKLRYYSLIPLLHLLTPTPVRETIRHLATDGKHLYYSPERVEKALRKADSDRILEIYMHELLHIVMHGFLGSFGAYYEDTDLAWAIQDLMAERFASMYQPDPEKPEFDDDEDFYDLEDVYDEDAEEALQWRERELENRKRLNKLLEKGMGAYHFIRPKKRSRAFLIEKGKEARRDNHHIWNEDYKKMWEEAASEILNLLSPELKELLRQMGGKPVSIQIQISQDGQPINALPIQGPQNMDLDSLTVLIKDAKSRSGEYGSGSGGAVQTVCGKKPSKNSYFETLRELCRETECNYEDPDSMDNMLYQFGLDLYGDMPLIEPCEENPRPQLENLVLAIDTSGSCSGPIAEKFIRETCQILRDGGALGHLKSITWIECDCEIQNVKEFEDVGEMMRALDGSVNLLGFGGTSFVPVFDWIRENKEAKGNDISALFYLTDGMGTYPDYAPTYPTYFVMPQMGVQFMQNNMQDKPWIKVLNMERNETPYEDYDCF